MVHSLRTDRSRMLPETVLRTLRISGKEKLVFLAKPYCVNDVSFFVAETLKKKKKTVPFVSLETGEHFVSNRLKEYIQCKLFVK